MRKEKKVIDALINIINESNREYESKMFENEFFSKIVGPELIKRYLSPILLEPRPQIALERISDKRIRYIELGMERGGSVVKTSATGLYLFSSFCN